MLLIAAPVVAQQPDGSTQRAAIARLSFMLGRWRGDAWMERAGQRMQTAMTETVEPRLDGTLLLVEGRGSVVTATGERVVHHALGVIHVDAATGGYALRSWIGSGQTGEFAMVVGDSSVSWSRDVPGGRIRNTARFTGGEWHEIGEFSADGSSWRQIMELRLRRDN